MDYPGVDERFCAIDAGQVGDVTGGAFCGNAVQSRLDDGIGLGVNGADAVSIHHEMPRLVAVSLTRRRPIEAGGEDALVPHEYTADEGAVAGASLGNGVGDLHEVRVPIGAHGKFLFVRKTASGHTWQFLRF